MFKKIRLALIGVVLCVTLALCSEARAGDEWDAWDTSLYTAHQVVRTVDMFQTADIYTKDEFYERNPIIDWGVDKYGTPFIPVWFATTAVAEYFIADALPSKYRKAFLAGGTAFSVGLVMHNQKIGLGLSFKF